MPQKTPARPPSRPWAFLITFACYGARLHGNERGSVDRLHNLPKSRYLPANPRRERYEREVMRESAYTLDANRRRTVLEAIRETCRTADWILHAVHIRTNHVHAVIEAETSQQTLLGRLKGRCSHDLRALDPQQSRKWARHSSPQNPHNRPKTTPARNETPNTPSGQSWATPPRPYAKPTTNRKASSAGSATAASAA